MMKRRAAFTLTELIVVVLIVGLLAAFAVPQYMKTVENSKLEDAQALMQMVGTTNRMFALDHGGAAYVSGQLSNTCNSGSCAASGWTSCDLVRCQYLAAQDWDTKPYVVYAAANNACTPCSGAGNAVACVKRRSGSSPGTNTSPYTSWGYAISANGAISPCSGSGFDTASQPPAPTQ